MATIASTVAQIPAPSTDPRSLPTINMTNPAATSAVLHRTLKCVPPQVVSANGKYLTFSNGKTILDTTCGAGVACIGYNNERVKKAMAEQLDKFAYCNSMFFSHPIGEELAAELINGTEGAMSKAYIMCSGSEAMEAAMKMARQYYVEAGQSKRINFIAREGSYHGTTLGSLSMSGHVARRSLFTDMLLPNIARVSACYPYRGMKDGQTTEEYVEQLAQELDLKFQELGPETVCAFVAEPVVGATLGCVPAVPGYFKAMKEVCEKHGALLILDEVMSGMGRCGSLHVWKQEDVVPDIQTIAKGLGGGYAPVAGILINHRISDALKDGTGQGHPVGCAASLEVQRIIREDNLVANVRTQGALLEKLLHEYLDGHPHVGNIRGKGLFWGIEFVQDKTSKEPFPRSADIANRVHLVGLNDLGISLYPGMGTKDGILGDHVLLAPAYTTTEEEVYEIAEKTRDTIIKTFEELSSIPSSQTVANQSR
ncbi:class III aminotransferase [Colletotrichum plurivorum]|uniref:Class III aminotransferase n=1 Tax=Colletotrichum plurivorum TaxID=2175906 RepID=A0A8H6K101_9PEZI|nr:class III aminotransferase [Colletotrichum plurivorum]